jgi:hypothetical protein
MVEASATPIYEEEEEAGEMQGVQGIVRRFKASDGSEYIVAFDSEDEARKFDRFCTSKSVAIKVENNIIRCIDRATKASVTIKPSSLLRAS